MYSFEHITLVYHISLVPIIYGVLLFNYFKTLEETKIMLTMRWMYIKITTGVRTCLKVVLGTCKFILENSNYSFIKTSYLTHVRLM
jgi:hypothetical protein